MRIGEDEIIDIWQIGNTGLRNPLRIQEGFRAFSQSRFVGNLHGRDNELAFMSFLGERGLINNAEGKDPSGSYARKWRLMFSRYGLIYPQIRGDVGFTQDDIGRLDEITPFGRAFIAADTIAAMQECFLRALAVEQYLLPNRQGYYSPFRWILSIMLELERRTGSSEITRIEFALFGHTTNPLYEVNDVVNHILDLRERRKNAMAKKRFDRNEIMLRSTFYDKKESNFKDYCDMNMRYLRASGVLQRKGRGLIISESKHIIAESLAKFSYSTEPLLHSIRALVSGAPLPTDNIDVARDVLNDMIRQLRQRHVAYDIHGLPMNTAQEINNIRHRLENLLSQTDEINYAADQKNKWQEISDYMSLILDGGGRMEYDEDTILEVPEDELPVYLEWVLWRATLAIDHLVNQPYEVRGFRIDSDFMPVSTAGGGRGDLYCEFENYTILTEVTMSSGSRQEAMEGEPVRRHVSDAVLNYDKPVLGLFVAVRIDTNTAETFRHGVWYASGDERQRLNIVPLTLAQFQEYFVKMFQADQASPDNLVELISNCTHQRDKMEAPAWKEYINQAVITASFDRGNETTGTERDTNVLHRPINNRFPFGIYYGSRIKDLINNRYGFVVGISEERIIIAFEDILEPVLVSVNADDFSTDVYMIT